MVRLLPANPKRRRADRPQTDWAGILAHQCAYGLPPDVSVAEREYLFAASVGRKFRADLAFIAERLLVEVDGGAYLPGGGRHNRAAGFVKDLEKMNLATILGWRVLRFTPQQVESGEAVRVIAAALAAPDAGAGARTRGEG